MAAAYLKCYTTWQAVLFFFIVLFLVPLPLFLLIIRRTLGRRVPGTPHVHAIMRVLERPYRAERKYWETIITGRGVIITMVFFFVSHYDVINTSRHHLSSWHGCAMSLWRHHLSDCTRDWLCVGLRWYLEVSGSVFCLHARLTGAFSFRTFQTPRSSHIRNNQSFLPHLHIRCVFYNVVDGVVDWGGETDFLYSFGITKRAFCQSRCAFCE